MKALTDFFVSIIIYDINKYIFFASSELLFFDRQKIKHQLHYDSFHTITDV
jgi:hypothetical protein